MMTRVLLFVSFLLSVYISLHHVEAGLIVDLPGLPAVNFSQYAGYITVDETNQRQLYYWFVESQRDPLNDKLVLWLNGGPGCSSIGGGLMTENGPFRVNPDGKTLSMNPSSWNNVANVIYLESPAGVGFSDSQNKSDYTVGDRRTANDAYIFLQKFLQEFPQYQNTQFWITGESYGGHYVPTLAERILQGNENLEPGFIQINIEGIMAGNAWTYMPIDNYGAIFYWWTHALISDQTFYGINSTCNFTDTGPDYDYSAVDQETCNDYMNTATQEMGNILIYDIYVDVCVSNNNNKIIKQLARAGSPFHKMLDKSISDRAEKENAKRNTIDPPYLPCADTYTSEYLNSLEVQEAIFVNPLNYTWYECSPYVHYNYSDVERSVIYLYDLFLQQGLKVLVYSGDVDAIVPYTGSRQWIADLNRPIMTPWAPYLLDQQVAGYVTVYKGLTFATVRNAGHMVPQTQPERSFLLFSKMLYGNFP